MTPRRAHHTLLLGAAICTGWAAAPDTTWAQDRATVRAARVTEPLVVDGVLDEPLYSTTTPVSAFVQAVPLEGGEPSQRTEAWVAFDDANVYVAARVHDTAPESAWIANEMRRDAAAIELNDQFGVFFDTYVDGRNGVGFFVNPLGGFTDLQITNEEDANLDWNPVTQIRTGRFAGGWTVELAIPFRSLRYRPGESQAWGIQMRRGIVRRNEWNHLTPLTSAMVGNGTRGAMRVSEYATLDGIETPPPSSLKLDVKPYGISGLRTEMTTTPQVENDGWADAGLDVKWGITENLTADLTYNTDFAQVEVDEQQANLSRFWLFFPEKRDFFLESQGIFEFGNGGRGPTSAGGGGPPGSPNVSSSGRTRGGRSANAPSLFYSRRVGLQSGSPVPILGGGRLTGKLGAFDVGAVGIRTDEATAVGVDPTTFAAVRLRRDVFSRSSIGLLAEHRSRSVVAATGSNELYGVDYNFAFMENMQVFGYWARTRTDGIDDHDQSLRTRAGWRGNTWSWSVDYVVVEDGFNPELGFVRRSDFRETNLFMRWSPRVPFVPAIRRANIAPIVTFIENDRLGYMETRNRTGRFELEFENGDWLTFIGNDAYERLADTTTISGARIPDGAYAFRNGELTYYFGSHRRLSGSVSLTRGGFYGGRVTGLSVTQGRIEVLPQLSVEPSLELNWIDLPTLQQSDGQFNQHIMRTRVTYTLSPRAFVSGLLQYNTSSNTVGANVRLRWEWAPGSELFVVYTERRDTDVLDRRSELAGRSFVVKATRLVRF
ncbi:MAG: carbohydrate binding family 9 domain-containing protein [Gemmatimonadetes bacterium]|nr:carbohydrate binding family 9 domain-containing protein [Gemmatimonadota bacterium]